MPLFVYIGRDAAGSAEKRPGARPDHLAHIEAIQPAEGLRFAGPLFAQDGGPAGSLIVFEADDYAAAKRIAEADPYIAAGVFERVEVFSTTQVKP